jgi:hypothetical protein
LQVICLADQPTEYAITDVSQVLSYVFGVTKSKSGTTLAADHRTPEPPRYRKILAQVAGERRDARFITLLSPHALACHWENEQLTVSTPLGKRDLQLKKESLTW